VVHYSTRCLTIYNLVPLKLRVTQQRVPRPANFQKLRTAIEEKWTNIPQATINNLKTAHFRVAFYCGQPNI